MKSLLKDDVVEKLNDLLKDFFKANSTTDLIAYCLEHEGYHGVSAIYHERIAHKFGGWADMVSDAMYYMGAKPVRKGFDGDTGSFDKISDMFKVNLDIFIALTDKVARLIEELDFDYKNKYMIIELENLLTVIQPYVRIADTWYSKALEYESHDNLYKFDKDFKKFIDIPE